MLNNVNIAMNIFGATINKLRDEGMADSVQEHRRQVLKELLSNYKKEGLTVAKLSRKHSIDPSHISQLKSGHRGFGEEAARNLEKALELPKFFFEPGYSNMDKDLFKSDNFTRTSVDGTKHAPVLNYVQAGEFCEYYDDAITDIFEPVSGEYPDNIYWVQIEGLSMMPDFKPGDLALINPDIQPSPGDYVIALKKDEKEVTFKKWRPRGFDDNGVEYFELVPLNPDFPIIDSRHTPFSICGVAVEHKKKLK